MNNNTELIFNKWTKCIDNIVKQTKVLDEKRNIFTNAQAVMNNESILLKNLETEESNLSRDLKEALKSEYGTK